ncbi:MAG: CaiB/BaiF CoA-transferase family protein [Desulfobacterales bacterium]|jgi:crotonobetainyl-CoA:carnitine CoA-transferase CaiB-like acyl-CoA transferase
MKPEKHQAENKKPPGALSGLLVIDLSRLLPGPYGSMILADHGARVIAIEDRRFQADALDALSHINRNKEHMTLNLKNERGLAVLHALVKKADVLLEGFRPGVTARLGIDYERVRRINPRIVYCSVTGYGQAGPLRDQAGHDVNFLAASGLLSLIGPAGGAPCIPGLQIGDLAGGLYAAVGILLALAAREKTGRGQYVDVSMTDALKSMAPIAAGRMWADGRPPARGDWLLSHRYACYNVYETADGRHLSVGALENRFWSALCESFNVPQFAGLQFDEERRQEILDFFRRAFRQKTRDRWLEIFHDRDVCLAGVLNLDEALDASAADTAPGFAHVPPAVKLSRTPASLRTRPPRFGEHTRSILTELGYDEPQIVKMEQEGAV